MSKKLILALGALLVGAFTGMGATTDDSVFSDKGTARADTNVNGCVSSVYVVSAIPAGTPVVKFLHFTTDAPTNEVIWWTSSATGVVTTNAGSTNSILYMVSTNGFTIGDTVVIQDISSDNYQVARVTNITTSVLHLGDNPGVFTIASNDVVHVMAAKGSLDVSTLGSFAAHGEAITKVWTSNLVLSGECLIAGPEGKPLLIEVEGTAAADLHSVSGVWWRRPRP